LNRATHHNNHETAQEVLFSGLFRQHEQRLHLLAFRLTKSEQTTQDIIQEVFLKLWEQRGNLDSIQKVEQAANDAELHVAAREYGQIIQKAISELPPQRKLIYKLNKEDGLNYQQIAEELQISRHTVKNQLFSAIQSVRRFIVKSTKLFSLIF